MTRPTVCIDVDNVLADYTGGLRRFVRETAGPDAYPCPDPVAYDFSLTGGWPFTGSPESYLDWHRLAVSHGCICLMVCVPVYRGFVGRVTGEKLTM